MDRNSEDWRKLRKGAEQNKARGFALTAGWSHVIFGMPFMLAGLFTLFSAVGIINSNDDSFHVPRWVVAVVGGIFVAAGILISLQGTLALWRKSRLRSLALRFPDEPWRADHEWRPRYSSDESGKRIFPSFLGAVFVAMFSVPFVYVGFFTAGGLPFAIGSCLPVFLTVFLLWQAIKLSMRQLKYGGGRIEYDNMPLVPRRRLKLRWVGNGAIGAYQKITFTLRCIQEKIQTRGRNNGRGGSKHYSRSTEWTEYFMIEEPGEHLAGD